MNLDKGHYPCLNDGSYDFIWQRPEIHDPLAGPEQKQTWKRFRTQSRTTGRVTCTLCSLYIDIESRHEPHDTFKYREQ